MGIGPQELILILLICLVLFGTKKLRNIGSDLGTAIKNFRQSMREGEEEANNPPPSPPPVQVTQSGEGAKIIEGHPVKSEHNKV